MEVIIASAIFIVAFVALGNHIGVGMRAATRGQVELIASTICQSILDEHIVSGVLKSTSQPQAVRGVAGWLFTTEVSRLNDKQVKQVIGMPDENSVVLLTVTTWKAGKKSDQSKMTMTQVVRRREASAVVSSFDRESR